MKSMDALTLPETVDLLNKCWMSHDGMWFFHCFHELGIQKANELNKAAIRSLAHLEIDRILESFAIGRKDISSFQRFREFFMEVSKIFIPEFMNVVWSFGVDDTLHWEFTEKKCFAYKGVRRIGVLDQYECGVIYRVQCWLDELAIEYSIDPAVKGCLMLTRNSCSGTIALRFPGEE
ncbi:MAG: hypothetical protein CVV44_01915 [Spirochaetae bacterium HGW-Spirochaetae-1]|nr:MAG: hypothetical protein CVV44_01915 [Spirochaetae bacterium HGW-Spirochaetae-1]